MELAKRSGDGSRLEAISRSRYMGNKRMDEPTPDVYEQLLTSLYAYRLGTISFLDLLERFEAALQIGSSQQTEVVDVNIVLVKGEGE